MEIKPIKEEVDYERALRRVEQLWASPKGSPESDELDVVVTLIDAYEKEHYPIDLPDPIEAIKFRLEQTGKDFRSLIGVIGQRTRVYEVMRGDRPLSLNMIRSLHEKFGISADVLIQPIRRKGKFRKNRSSVKNNRFGRSGMRSSASVPQTHR
jgi:HTH-type transcriptional regulator / antitoxin HigA